MFEAIALASIVAYLFYSAGTNLSDKISFSPVSFNLAQSLLTLKITNPTDTSAKISSVEGVILAGGKFIGSYKVTSPFQIPARSAANIKVKIKLDAPAVITQISDVLLSGKTPVVSITGKIGTLFGSVKFENTLVESTNFYKSNA